MSLLKSILVFLSLATALAAQRTPVGGKACSPEVAIQTVNDQAVSTGPTSLTGVKNATVDGRVSGCVTLAGNIAVGILVFSRRRSNRRCCRRPASTLESNSGTHGSDAASRCAYGRWVDEDGLSARRVKNRLTELKMPPRKGAAVWAKSSVLRILQNEMYAGTWHYNKFQGCEPAKVSPGYRKRKKCSLRARPRSEWLPLALPEDLQIISRERWLRVQHRTPH